MKPQKSVVITGIGVVSPVGIGNHSFWEALRNGISGIRVRREFEGTDVSTKLVAKVDDFDPRKFITAKKAIKIMCGPIQFGCAAAMMACEQAQIGPSIIDPDRIGTLFGTETFYSDPLEVADVFQSCTFEKNYNHDKWGEFAIRKIQPLWMLKYLPNMAASHISIMLDARGHSNSICQGEVSGLIAMIEAINVINRGWCDAMIVGGTGSMSELSAMLYRGNDLSTRFNETPEKASRPFGRDRDGMIPGEGAAAMVIELEENAIKRGATPLARITGWSQGFAGCPGQDFSEAISSGFRDALNRAGLTSDQIGSVNAHGCGRVTVDAWEAEAIQRVFGETLVVANKGNFGNLGPGAASVEMAAAALSLVKRQHPPTVNWDQADPSCKIRLSRPEEPWDNERERILKSSISETGQVAAIILESLKS